MGGQAVPALAAGEARAKAEVTEDLGGHWHRPGAVAGIAVAAAVVVKCSRICNPSAAFSSSATVGAVGAAGEAGLEVVGMTELWQLRLQALVMTGQGRGVGHLMRSLCIGDYTHIFFADEPASPSRCR